MHSRWLSQNNILSKFSPIRDLHGAKNQARDEMQFIQYTGENMSKRSGFDELFRFMLHLSQTTVLSQGRGESRATACFLTNTGEGVQPGQDCARK